MDSPGATAAELAIQRRKRGTNYSDEECVQICRTWLHIGEDPVQGSGQKNGALWKRMHSHFKENKPGGVERSWRSLQSKWSDIQHDTCKFMRSYAAVEALAEPATNEDIKVDRALTLYKEQNPKKEAYAFLQCWRILRDSSKFMEYCAGESGCPKRQESSDTVDTAQAEKPERQITLKSVKRQKLMKAQVKNAERNLKIIGEAQKIRAEAIQLQTYMTLFTTPMGDLDEQAAEFFKLQKAQVLEKLKNELLNKRSSDLTPHTIVDVEEEPDSNSQDQVDLGSSEDEIAENALAHLSTN